MNDYRAGLNDRMVSGLVSRGLVCDRAVEAAFRAVPRHFFLPDTSVEKIYAPDEAVPTRYDDAGMPISSSSARLTSWRSWSPSSA